MGYLGYIISDAGVSTDPSKIDHVGRKVSRLVPLQTHRLIKLARNNFDLAMACMAPTNTLKKYPEKSTVVDYVLT